MKRFIRYCITQIWGALGLGIALYVVAYPVAYSKLLPISTMVICVFVASICAIIYSRMIKWFKNKEKM